MKSIRNIGSLDAGLPVLADDVLELHAARLLLLFRLCGTHKRRMDGLTKMAKLDFFVRYPLFFNEVSKRLGDSVASETRPVESSMVRFHYGPWDPRYYHVLAYLEGKQLLSVAKEGKTFQFELTELGQTAADKLIEKPAFGTMIEHMHRVKKLLGGKTGSALKKLVYQVFEEEVSKRSLGEVIS
jgi:hypothetical protein